MVPDRDGAKRQRQLLRLFQPLWFELTASDPDNKAASHRHTGTENVE